MTTINEFSNAFGQGQRATLFRVEGIIPGSSRSGNSQNRQFFIKAAQLPASTIGFIEVPYKGRKVKRPGDRTFAEWTLTVLQDENNLIREDFIEWMNKINDHEMITGDSVTESLFPSWSLTALKQDDSHADGRDTTVDIFNCFPTEVGTIEFNYETVDTFTEFTVTLQYDYWTSTGAPGVG
tara:strand:+ start:214 stop:756 length:543 start_codon:yes stop_codon:yes gene_type:complete